MTDYAALLATVERYNTDQYNCQPERERADMYMLADQMAAELSTDEITPQEVAAC